MELTRHQTAEGSCWACDGHLLPQQFNLHVLLGLPKQTLLELLKLLPSDEPAPPAVLPPIEPMQEVWASGVTYMRSRDARKAESAVADVYDMVYEAERPELFFKAIGWRVVGHGMAVRARQDSIWDVPEPELVLVVNRDLEIVGYCAGNDMSSRSIEGENPLYLPQAKMYNASCALGPGIVIAEPDMMRDLLIRLEITRNNGIVFGGETRTSQMKRPLEELVGYLAKELAFPNGAFLMTGTGIVPPEEFSLQSGDMVQIMVGACSLANPVIKDAGEVLA
jgi:2-dehydro-3-deoxy-D-arabinonate dehydratase